MKRPIIVVTIIYLLSFFTGRTALAQPPPFTATVFDSTFSGYYFLSSKDDPTMMMLDGKGNVIYYRSGTHRNDFTLWPNGLMSFAAKGTFHIMDSTFTDVDTVTTKNLDMEDTHELRILPNGNFLMIGADLVTMDLSQYYWKGEFGNTNDIVQCGVIQELDASGNIVFEWHAKDYYSFDDVDTFFLYHQPVINWTHSNAIEVDTDGNLLFSTRNFNEITKINRSDSSIMWRLGGKQNQFTFVNRPLPFYAQHDIRRVSNGHITLYDNGNYITPHGGRGLEFALDETNKIATQTWDYMYDSTISSNSLGSVQRLENSKTLVNFGNVLSGTIGFVVVDSAGSKIFQLDGVTSYRVFYYPSLPWQLHRPQVNSFDSLGVTWLDAGAGYASYRWSNGNTTRKISTGTVQDTLFVYVPYGQGGFISSEKFIVNGIPQLPSYITITGGTAKVCPGEIRTYSVVQGGGITYNWTVPTGATINSGQGTSSVNVTYDASFIAAGTISVTATNSYGTGAARNLTVNRNNPAATITTTGPTTICSGTNALTLKAPLGTGLTYQWKKGVNNIAGATNQSYVPTATSNAYKVVVTNAPGCSKTSGTVAVTVNPLPSAAITPLGSTTFCAGDSVILQANSGTNLIYQWKKGAVNISAASFQNYTAKVGGSYKVIVTSSNGCSKTSTGTVITVNCRSSNEVNEESSMELFPNPSTGAIQITFNSIHNAPLQCEIINVVGEKIYETKLQTLNFKLETPLDVSFLAKGIYLVRVGDGLKWENKKMVVE
ncbi:MAG: aryl-sulfate sulfotransferase [Bacteroidia bacterium]